jgi:hypothetical protein
MGNESGMKILNHQTRAIVASSIVSMSLLLEGCNQLEQFGIGTTPINDVTQNPDPKQVVTVRGDVVNEIGILGQGAYQIKDSTGSIWVLTKSGLPKRNSTVTVKGRATQGATFAGINVAVTLAEEERQ